MKKDALLKQVDDSTKGKTDETSAFAALYAAIEQARDNLKSLKLFAGLQVIFAKELKDAAYDVQWGRVRAFTHPVGLGQLTASDQKSTFLTKAQNGEPTIYTVLLRMLEKYRTHLNTHSMSY